MISIRTFADATRSLASPLDMDVLKLLQLRLEQFSRYEVPDLGELAHFIIVEPGDTIASIEGVAGVPFATNFVDGTRYGEPGFSDNFEFVKRHGGWFEAVTILSDDGFGVALIVPDRTDIDPVLLGLIRDRP